MISRHHWYIVRMFVDRPRVSSTIELKWNHIIRPDVLRRADRAPVRGQGLGFTMWYEWVWWVIMCCHGGIGLLGG